MPESKESPNIRHRLKKRLEKYRNEENSWLDLNRALGVNEDNIDENLQATENTDLVARLIPKLKPQEVQILIYRYVDGLTQKQVGEYFGFTASWAGQIERHALKTLRWWIERGEKQIDKLGDDSTNLW